MSGMVPNKWNVFESELDFDPAFFSASPYRSKSFVLVTVLLSIDLGVAASVGIAFWPLMSNTMKILYLLFIVGLPIVWIRMLRDHRKMRSWYATAPPDQTNGYAVCMASHLMTFTPYYLYLLVFFLLLCLAGVLRHQAGVSG
jgi:hypothetical protein